MYTYEHLCMYINTHSEDELQCFMNHFVSACNSFGLKINLKKTVVMYNLAPRMPYIKLSSLKVTN